MTCTCLRTTSTHRVNGERHNKTGVPHCLVCSGPIKTRNYTHVHCCLTMPRLRAELRERATGMLEAGMAARAVARRLNVHESTISRLRSRYQKTNSTRDRARTGRPRVTTPAQDNNIRLRHLHNRQLTAASTARETPGTHNPRISEHTVRRRLRDAGLRCRLQWGRNYRDWTINHWLQVLFTDESRFCLSRADGRTRVWRRPGERYSDAAVIQRDRWGGQSVAI